jgi:hypothetical protein
MAGGRRRHRGVGVVGIGRFACTAATLHKRLRIGDLRKRFFYDYFFRELHFFLRWSCPWAFATAYRR